MDPVEFFAACRLLIVAGKGGVGKTTVTAALARAAAGAGLRTLVVEVEGKTGLSAMFGVQELGYVEQVLLAADPALGRGEVLGRTVTPDRALYDYLADHGLKRLSNRLVRTGVLDVVATAAPGIDDILVLGKVKQIERSGLFDLILLDAPAAGHAVTFLQSARGLLDAVKSGPVHTQARDVLELLTDPHRCQVLLVTLPEETPVNEVVDTAFALEDRVGVSLGPVVVNALVAEPGSLDDALAELHRAEEAGEIDERDAAALRDAAVFRQHRLALQREQVQRLNDQLPLPRLSLPFLYTTALGPDDVDVLAAHLVAGLGALAA